MTIRIYNTLSRRKEEFRPERPGKVGMYVCGPTVYSASHVGHMVGPVVFDAVKRYLEYCGYAVTLVINITDIDDKIIVQAAKEGCSVAALAEQVTRDYLENLARLGVRVDHFPRATQHIDEIQRIITGLIEKGYAYAVGGDVYFDVTRASDYGKLSNRRPEELLAGTRKEVSDIKRNAGDFALWKAAKPGEPAWPSPWGPGRPGWHIECSAMSMKLLGETFDIHGGGLDLCFPHHEDEIAQSESFTGRPFARYWMHNGLMQYGGEARKIGARAGDQEAGKMSKSKGNVVSIRDLLRRHAPQLVRFFLLSTHYRRPIFFNDEHLEEVGRGFGRLCQLCDRAGRILGTPFHQLAAPAGRAPVPFDPESSELLARSAELRERFLECMDDDFNTGGAIGVLFELAPELNRYADEKNLEDPAANAADREVFGKAVLVLRELAGVLGILEEPLPAADAAEIGSLTPKLLDLFLAIRQELRQARQYALADRVREGLADLGVTIEDRPDGSRWKLE